MKMNRVNNLRDPQRTALEQLFNKQPEVLKAIETAKVDWYAIRNEADSVTEIFIYEEIGYWGITSDDFVKDLSNINAKTINLRINSPGGSVFDAIAIYNALVQHPATVNVYVDALAASAASVIAMAGDTVTMMVGSQLMIHDAIGIAIGNPAMLQDYTDWLNGQSDNIASIYAMRSDSLDTAGWREKMIAETWLFADEAVQLGLADEIYSGSKPAPTPDEPAPSEDAPAEDTPEEDAAEDSGDDIEDKFSKAHNLRNRGFKYSGRESAPGIATTTDDLINAICDAFSSFGGK